MIPNPVKHQVARLRRNGKEDYFLGKFFERDLFIYDADHLSRGWYGKEWNAENRSEFSALARTGLPHDALIFDIGAHQGVVSILLKELLAPHGKVVALEMDAQNAQAAQKNIDKNDICGIDIHHMAISDRSSIIRYTGRSNSNIAPQSPLNVLLPKVRTTSIDDLSRIHGTPQLIYLDVEGAEILALQGAKEVLSQGPVWFIELHGDEACAQFGGRNEDIISTLHVHGYRVQFASSEASEFIEIDAAHDHSTRGFVIATPGQKELNA